jgi:serine/threonine-protein kinase
MRFCPVDASPLRLIVDSGDLSGRMIAGRYELISKIGEGGMGEVYLAEQVTIGRRCAVKVMKRTLVDDRDAVARFGREASNASRINHTNVAAVYDFGEADGILYLVMEYVPGQSLSSLLAPKVPLAVERVLGIGLQIADALAVAHDAGVIHRDLKPDNIMLVTTRHGTELAKVVDFGIAKAASGSGQTVTGRGLIIGTPGYMSPEQLLGDPIDQRSDLYSLGCVLYTALVGESPFGTTAEEQIARRLVEPPPSVRSKNSSVPPAVDAVISRMLNRDPNTRYQNAREVRAALVAAWTSPDAAASAYPAASSLLSAHALSATDVFGQPGRPIAEVPSAPLSEVAASTPPPSVNERVASRKSTPAIAAALAAVVGIAFSGGAWYLVSGNRGRTATRADSQSATAIPEVTQPAPNTAAPSARAEQAGNSRPADHSADRTTARAANAVASRPPEGRRGAESPKRTPHTQTEQAAPNAPVQRVAAAPPSSPGVTDTATSTPAKPNVPTPAEIAANNAATMRRAADRAVQKLDSALHGGNRQVFASYLLADETDRIWKSFEQTAILRGAASLVDFNSADTTAIVLITVHDQSTAAPLESRYRARFVAVSNGGLQVLTLTRIRR